MVVAYVFLVIISGVGVWLAYWWLRVRHFEGYLKDIPGPKPLPIFGNGLEFASSTNILNTLTKYHKQFKGNFKVYVGSQPFIFFSEPKDLEFLLNSPILLAKSLPYRQLHSWLGTGLLTGSGDKWRKHRKIITPAFHFQILEEFVDIFNSAGDVLVSKLNEVCSQNISIDIYPFMTRCTLDIICETAMGTSVDAQNDVNSEYFKSVNVLLKILIDRAFSPFLSNDFFYRFSSTYQREQEALKVVHGYSKTVIERKMKEFLKNRNTKEQAVDDLGRKKKKAFLDLLLEYSSTDPSFTYENICEEVDTFMFEGHDTTATSISFALFALAAHPEVQKNAFSELQSIFSNDFYRSPTYQDLHEMRYLELVIRESLRIYTTIPFTGRTISQDTSFNGRTLPKGVMANLFSHATHNSEMIYKDPEKFQPERHTPENAAGKNIFSYVPFSAGPRNCIGQKFAMLEMKSIMSNVLRHFELTPAVPEHKLDLRSEAVLKSENGVIVQLKKRRAL